VRRFPSIAPRNDDQEYHRGFEPCLSFALDLHGEIIVGERLRRGDRSCEFRKIKENGMAQAGRMDMMCDWAIDGLVVGTIQNGALPTLDRKK
jgi:hypothetical protein